MLTITPPEVPFFLSFYITTKTVEISLSALSFFHFVLSFSLLFFLSLKITTKTAEILPFLLSFLPSFFFFFSILKSACCYDCRLNNLSAFFSFLFRCGKLKVTWFLLSFSLIFLKRQKPHFLFFSFFYYFLNIMYTDAQKYIQNAILLFYIIRR